MKHENTVSAPPTELPEEPDTSPCYEETGRVHNEWVSYSETLRSLCQQQQEQLEHDRGVHEVTVNDRERLREHLGGVIEQQQERIKLLEGDLRISKASWNHACHDIDALQEKIKELEKDAGRYRWLRERPSLIGWDWWPRKPQKNVAITAEFMDAAVDDERGEGKP